MTADHPNSDGRVRHSAQAIMGTMVVKEQQAFLTLRSVGAASGRSFSTEPMPSKEDSMIDDLSSYMLSPVIKVQPMAPSATLKFLPINLGTAAENTHARVHTLSQSTQTTRVLRKCFLDRYFKAFITASKNHCWRRFITRPKLSECLHPLALRDRDLHVDEKDLTIFDRRFKWGWCGHLIRARKQHFLFAEPSKQCSARNCGPLINFAVGNHRQNSLRDIAIDEADGGGIVASVVSDFIES
jgi:hypothetical protein